VAPSAISPRRRAIERLGVDVMLECSGNEQGTRSGLAALAPQGTMIILGGATNPGLDPLTILLKELRVKGSFI
jgi:threonine dehydrogenase-like Zn-dependent dehydrogenase